LTKYSITFSQKLGSSFYKKHVDGQINRLAHYESLSFSSFIEYIIIFNFNSLRFKYSGM